MSKQYSRAVDPDPHSFCLQVPDPPPDTGGKLMKKKQKNAGKLVVTVILNCKFRPAPYFFFTSELSLLPFSTQENSSYGYFIQICLKLEKHLDPQKMNADLQP